MDTQAILNKVLDSGLYHEKWFMCHALRKAALLGVVSSDECIFAEDEIDAWLTSFDVDPEVVEEYGLPGVLKRVGLCEQELSPRDFVEQYGLAIYRDWANRPMP